MNNSLTLVQSYLLRGMHSLKTKNGNLEPIHGHHYKIEVSFKSEVDKISGLVKDRNIMDQTVNEKIILPFNNSDFSESFEFSSGEYLAKFFFNILKESQLGDNLTKVSIKETNKNRFTCNG